MESAKPELPLLGQSVAPGDERRFISIGAKLGLAVVLVVTIATVLAFLHSTRRERDTLVEAKRQAADMVADLFAESLRAPLDFGDSDAVKAELDNLKQNRDVLYAGVWLTGKTEPIGSLGSPATGNVAGSKAHSTRVLPDLVEVARVIRGREGAELGHATVQLSLARENAAYLANRMRILWLCLAVALGTVGVLLTITRLQVVAPIDAMLAAVRRLERGDRNVRVAVQHRDEIGRLARAVEAMGAAIGDREARLAEAHRSLRELFDHMRQAILVFDREGRVTGAASRQATSVFRQKQLEGAQVENLLFPDSGPWDAELRAFREWLALAFDTRLSSFDEVATFAPPEVRLPTEQGELTLSLEFRPIGSAGAVDRIMLLATDETEKAALQRTVIEQGEAHARQMAAMQRLVTGGGQQFVTFLTGARTRLARAVELTRGKGALPLGELNECFGLVHTLRGEARVFGLEELAQQLERIEARLSKLRAEALATSARELELDSQELSTMLSETERAVDEAERLFVEASPIGRAVLDQVTVRRPDLERLCELAAKQGGEQRRLAERLSARSLGELTAPYSDKVARWAESLNKRARLEVLEPQILLPRPLAEVMGGALTHLLRNAVAHGIELPDERERDKKPTVGVIRIGAVAANGSDLAQSLYVEDDGVGITNNPLLSAAATRERPLSNQDTPSGSFRAAKEQIENELSGRGMGLSAVVRELQGAGFSLLVRELASGGTRFEIAPLTPQALSRGAVS
jgi:methyl-accepting chemotaxis protein